METITTILTKTKQFVYTAPTQIGEVKLDFTLNIDNAAHCSAYYKMLLKAAGDVKLELGRLGKKV